MVKFSELVNLLAIPWQDNDFEVMNNILSLNCTPTNIKLETHIVILDILYNIIYVVGFIYSCT